MSFRHAVASCKHVTWGSLWMTFEAGENASCIPPGPRRARSNNGFMKTNGTNARSRPRAARAENGKGNGARKTSKKSSYDTFKEYEGTRYTGMKIGRGHKWRYDEGDWVERKLTPEKWEIRFTTKKRRRGHAPEGSGVPVGTEYHWYVLADQTVKKLDANNYATEMVGHKYKLSHKRADKGTWSASESAQRRHLVKILKSMIAELEKESKTPARATNEKSATGATAKADGRAKHKAPAAARKRASSARHLAAA